jgi:hypothetical protein
MAIKDGDKDWIRTEIRTAIQEHLNPNGWRKLQGYLPLVGILGCQRQRKTEPFWPVLDGASDPPEPRW